MRRFIGHHFEQRNYVLAPAFSEEEVERLLVYCHRLELEDGVIRGANRYERHAEVRRSRVAFFFEDRDSSWIFQRIDDVIEALNGMYFGYDIYGYDRIQYARYDSADCGHYDWHSDVGQLSPTRKLSASVLLTEGRTGGELMVNLGSEADAVDTGLRAGQLALFPSSTIHRVMPVTAGVRESLVVWVLGPKLR